MTTKFYSTIQLPQVNLGDYPKVLKTYDKTNQPETDYIGLSAEILDLSKQETVWFFYEVGGMLTKHPLDEYIYLAVKALPINEKTAKGVPIKLAEDFGYCVKKPQSFRRPPRPQVIETAVVGITHAGRQEVVDRLWSGEEVILRREPNNLYDRKAIMVLRWNDEQIGYIERGLASTLALKFDAYGEDVRAVITKTSRSKSYRSGYITWPFIKFTVPD